MGDNKYLKKIREIVEVIDYDLENKYYEEKDLDDITAIKDKLATRNMLGLSNLSEKEIEFKLYGIKNYYKIFKDNQDKIEEHEKAQDINRNSIEYLKSSIKYYQERINEFLKMKDSMNQILQNKDNKDYDERFEKNYKKFEEICEEQKEKVSIIEELLKERERLNVSYNNLWEDLYKGNGLKEENIVKGLEKIVNIMEQSGVQTKPEVEPDQNPEQDQNPDPNQNPEPDQNPEPNQNPDPNQNPEPDQNPEPNQNPDPDQTEDISKIQKAVNAKYEIVLNNNGVELTINGEKILVDEHRIRTMMEYQKNNPKKFMDLIGKYSGLIKDEFKDEAEAKKVLTEKGLDIDKLKEIDPMILACASKLRVLKEDEKGAVLLSNYLRAYEGRASEEELEKLSITYDLKDLSKRARLLQRAFTTKNYFNLQNKKEIAERAKKAQELGIAEVDGEYKPSRMDRFFGKLEKKDKKDKKVKLLGPGSKDNSFREGLKVDIKSKDAIQQYYKAKEEAIKNQKQKNEEEQEP